MSLFTTENIEEDTSAEAGIFWHDIARAIMVWAVMQNREPTVAEAALAFNTLPTVIRTAVTEHNQWLFLSPKGADVPPDQQRIGVDGD